MDILTVILLFLLNLQMLLLVVSNITPMIKKWLAKAEREPQTQAEKERQEQMIREMNNFFSYTGDSQKDE